SVALKLIIIIRYGKASTQRSDDGPNASTRRLGKPSEALAQHQAHLRLLEAERPIQIAVVDAVPHAQLRNQPGDLPGVHPGAEDIHLLHVVPALAEVVIVGIVAGYQLPSQRVV